MVGPHPWLVQDGNVAMPDRNRDATDEREPCCPIKNMDVSLRHGRALSRPSTFSSRYKVSKTWITAPSPVMTIGATFRATLTSCQNRAVISLNHRNMPRDIARQGPIEPRIV
jgi:hypothetical protein